MLLTRHPKTLETISFLTLDAGEGTVGTNPNEVFSVDPANPFNHACGAGMQPLSCLELY